MSYNLNGDTWDQIFTEMVSKQLFPQIMNRALFFGVSQSGKSTLLHNLLHSERVTFHAGMPLDDLIGGMALVNGSTVWQDGPAVRALRMGKCLQIDEINDMPIECKTMMYALLDRPAGITLPTGERVNAAPGYCVVGTMNPTPNALPDPIFQRFDVIFRVMTMSSGVKSALGGFVNQAERVFARAAEKVEWTRPMSVGLLLAAARMRARGVDNDTIVKALGMNETEAADFLASITE